jgi:hypothetical protein
MEITAGPLQFAEALPKETRLERFRRLAELRLKCRETFNAWADEHKVEKTEDAFTIWRSAWDAIKARDMFDVLRMAAVFDESFRLPQLNAGTEEFQLTVEQKFSRLMQRVSLLALTIQEDQEKLSKGKTDASSNPDGERNNLQ